MRWLTLPRRPESEVMSDAEEGDAYAPAAAQACLDAIDNTLVDQVLSLGGTSAWLLDRVRGPGGIPLKIARCPPNTQGMSIGWSAGIG
jgi:hypothetical protein